MLPHLRIARLVSLSLAFAAGHVSAQETYYWNPTGNTEGQGGSGLIDATTPLWNETTTPSDALVAWNSGNHAVFAGSGGTITSNGASLVTGDFIFRATPYVLEGDLSLTGRVIVENLGSLTATDAVTTGGDLGLYNGTLNVNGGSLTAAAHAYIGIDNTSNGRLNITDGGSASFTSISIGTFESSYGFITVDGAGSTLAATGGIIVGQGGYGSLTIQDGADVTAPSVTFGTGDGAAGHGLITGEGSSLTVSGSMQVGFAGGSSGSLTVAEGGVFEATDGDLLLGNATLSIGTADGAAGTVQVASIVGSTDSRVRFDHNETAYTFSAPLHGVQIEQVGSGTTILGSASGYLSGTTIGNGTLRLGADQALGIGSDLTLAGGALELNGYAQTSDRLHVTGDSIIDFSGGSSLAFGNSSGFIWDGSLTLLNFGAGDVFRFGTDAFGLTAEQLMMISIDGFYAQIDAGGYITANVSAIPEPSTYAVVFGVVALAGAVFHRRRRMGAAGQTRRETAAV